jgi:hypothetical protein
MNGCSMDKKPLIDRLEQAITDWRQRHATHGPAPDEQPLTELEFAREIKKRGRVEDGQSMVGSLATFFHDWATKYESAFAVYGIPLLQIRTNQLRVLANGFQDAATTIRTYIQIEQERTQEAIKKKQTTVTDRQAIIKTILIEKQWGRFTPSLPKQVWSELKARGVTVSPRTIYRDLEAFFDTSSL